MGIGYHVAKALAAKEAAAQAAEDVTDVATPTPEPTVSQSDFLGALKLLLQEIRGADNAGSKERLALEAERLLLEQERVKREMPENKQAPGISVYSHPEGDLIHPKDPLKCKMFWVGYELSLDTLTPREVDLLNRLQPGTFKVTKSDGTVIPFNVAAKHNDRFQLEELSIWFPCKGDHRQNHGSMTSYLQQALGEHIPSADELMLEVARLRMELVREKAGVVGVV